MYLLQSGLHRDCLKNNRNKTQNWSLSTWVPTIQSRLGFINSREVYCKIMLLVLNKPCFNSWIPIRALYQFASIDITFLTEPPLPFFVKVCFIRPQVDSSGLFEESRRKWIANQLEKSIWWIKKNKIRQEVPDRKIFVRWIEFNFRVCKCECRKMERWKIHRIKRWMYILTEFVLQIISGWNSWLCFHHVFSVYTSYLTCWRQKGMEIEGF